MYTLKDNLKVKLIYYVVLVIAVVLYSAEFGVGHYTHTFVLLMESYSTLCNILGLLAVIIANKFGQSASETTLDKLVVWTTNTTVALGNDQNRLTNTFGWKRYLTLSLLIRYVFLSSAVFSLSLESLEILINHEEVPHKGHFHLAFYVGITGLLLNVIFHSAVHGYLNYNVTPLRNIPSNAITTLQTEDTEEAASKSKKRKLKIKLIASDFVGPITILIYSGVVHFTNSRFMVYTDTVLTLILGALLLILNYPLLKHSGAILLQKIPDTIDIENLRTQLLQKFPDVLNIHDLHVWQLTAEKVVSTVHITFKNPTVYPKLTQNLLIFFQKFGIDEATIQPEFLKEEAARAIQFGNVTSSCLMECQNDDCKDSFCCPSLPQVISRKHKGSVLFKESVLDCGTVNVKSMKIYSTQQTFMNKEFSID